MPRRLTQDEFSATHRIFSHVETLVGPYYGWRPLNETMKYVSSNKWIMFPDKGIDSLREGTELPVPNIFLSFEDMVEDDGNGRANGWMGVTYNNVDAMVGLRDLLRRKMKSRALTSLLSGLGRGWSIEIQHKTSTDCPDSAPHYSTVQAFPPSGVTTTLLRKAIATGDASNLRRGDPYPPTGNPVMWEVTIFAAQRKTTVADFDAHMRECFDLFQNMRAI